VERVDVRDSGGGELFCETQTNEEVVWCNVTGATLPRGTWINAAIDNEVEFREDWRRNKSGRWSKTVGISFGVAHWPQPGHTNVGPRSKLFKVRSGQSLRGAWYFIRTL